MDKIRFCSSFKVSEQVNGVQMASIITDLLGLKAFSCIIAGFMVGSTLPNVLMKIRSLHKTGNLR